MPYPETTSISPTPAPRGLIVAWCLWLLGAWLVTLYIDSATPGARWMVVISLMGLMLFWPVVRLSQDHTTARLRRLNLGQRISPIADVKMVLLDWLCLNIVFQVVIWPLRLYAQWRMEQALWVIAAVAAYSLLTGVIVAWGLTPAAGESGALRRSLAMIACLLLVFGEPLALALAAMVEPGLTWTMRVSPLQAVWELAATPTQFDLRIWPRVLGSLIVAALAGYFVLVALFRSDTPSQSFEAH